MLLPDGSVRILDFGLAKARDQSLTQSGVIVGTISYMAPEQIRGDALDGRADLWALGIVLYEMLTGHRPFDSEQDIAIAHAILHDEPAFLSTHRADIPAAVEDLVLRLVTKDRARRYAGARQVADLCCGIGGDTGALAVEHAVVAVDRDPLHAGLARFNAQVRKAAGPARFVPNRPGAPRQRCRQRGANP